MGWDSSLWTIGGYAIWVFILAFPLTLYFLIAAFQGRRSSQARRNPHIELGEKTEEPDQRKAG